MTLEYYINKIKSTKVQEEEYINVFLFLYIVYPYIKVLVKSHETKILQINIKLKGYKCESIILIITSIKTNILTYRAIISYQKYF